MSHSIILTSDRECYVSGANNSFQLGVVEDYVEPQVNYFLDYHPDEVQPEQGFVLNPMLKNIVKVATYSDKSAVIDGDGNVIIFGYYQSVSTRPYLLKFPERIIIQEVSIGENHCIFLDSTQGVWVNGSYPEKVEAEEEIYYDEIPRLQPVKMTGLPQIKSICAGNDLSMYIDIQGNLLISRCDRSGGPYALENYFNMRSPVIVPDLPKIQATAAGKNHIIILDYNGKVWSIGDNKRGQLGKNFRMDLSEFGINWSNSRMDLGQFGMINVLPEIIAISCGYNHSLLLDINGSVWGFGDNRRFQLGVGEDKIITPTELGLYGIVEIKASGNFSLVVNNNKEVIGFGNNSKNQIGRRQRGSHSQAPSVVAVFDGSTPYLHGIPVDRFQKTKRPSYL